MDLLGGYVTDNHSTASEKYSSSAKRTTVISPMAAPSLENALKRKHPQSNMVQSPPEEVCARRADSFDNKATACLQNGEPLVLAPSYGNQNNCYDFVSMNLSREKNPEIMRYLDSDVEALQFPDTTGGGLLRGSENEKAPLVLDGSSGVGKTQQAIVQLKESKKGLLYVLLTTLDIKQAIYTEMDDICLFNQFVILCNRAITALTEEGIDFVSTKNIRRHIKSMALKPLLNFMRNKQLYYLLSSGEHTINQRRISNTQTISDDYFLDSILFVDEALPPNSKEEDKNRLRFVRNLGRVLGMKVFIVGTSAACANVLECPDNGLCFSRQDIKENTFRWMDYRFIWTPMTGSSLDSLSSKDRRIEQQVPKKLLGVELTDLREVLLLHRPLFVLTFVRELVYETNLNIADILYGVGRQLIKSKGLNRAKCQGKVFVWLSGAWLDSSCQASSPYTIAPPEMVNGHFFEPAMASSVSTTRMHGEEVVPRLTNILGCVNVTSAPLHITLYKVPVCDLKHKGEGRQTRRPKAVGSSRWLMRAARKESNSHSALTSNFRAIQAAMSLCVQQCLKREPLLAIALSIHHRLTADEFSSGIHQCVRESIYDRTVGAINGELHEHIAYAALQQANGDNIEEPNNISTFIITLIKYLSPGREAEQIEVHDDICEELKFGPIHYHHGKRGVTCCFGKWSQNDPTDTIPKDWFSSNIDNIEKEFGSTTCVSIPWLVPACSNDIRYNACLSTVFGGLNIAALVPGSTNARCDINAYEWPPRDSADPEPLWKFEVKSRSDHYSMTTGVKDIVDKCGDKEGKGMFNAMLIGIRGQTKTEVCVWRVMPVNEVSYLRVVILVAAK
jgi:hypothetical protein